MTAGPVDSRRSIRSLNIIGFSVVAILFGGLGVWAATGELAGAVIAPGSVVVESNVKKIQHPTGGIVGEIFVHDGDAVEAGDILIRLDDTVTRSTLGVVRSQLDELLVREARLITERDEAESIELTDDQRGRQNDRMLARALAGEEKLFQSRRAARVGQRAQLRERISQSNDEIRGLSAQQAAKEAESGFIADELVGVKSLYDRHLVSISRLMALQRDKARIDGERGQFVAEIARVRGKISETELQIIQIDRDFRTDVLKELREAQGKIAELRERLVAAEDQLKRVDIRAPIPGIVLQLSVHTVGGVITASEMIMQIVPSDDSLVIDAKVSPQDIDQITTGAKAIVRIMAGNQRTMMDLEGTLMRISADLAHDPPTSGQISSPYYQVRISLPRAEIERLGNFRLVPGMPAEAFIQTYSRTALQYLLKPLHDQLARTFIER
ncbi:MAG: HlyD family type I secretion periplasmic adaptor subunit [Rhizobiales bacterium]|nr:HlyD family type I secretion periplasmic adaptor subunit [Hyphomicrobiales bacterium]